jgi:tetratricopeptide (TPR) repeat protein
MEQRSVEDLTDGARAACTAADWPRAIDCFRGLIRAEPLQSRHWMNLGVAYDNAGQPELALGGFIRARLLQPNSDLHTNNLASRIDPGREAELHFKLIAQLLLLDPLHVRARIMSLINRLTSHLDGPAIVESMRVQVVRCDEGEALFFGAQAAERMGRRELAGRWLRHYLVIDPRSRAALHGISNGWACSGGRKRSRISTSPDCSTITHRCSISTWSKSLNTARRKPWSACWPWDTALKRFGHVGRSILAVVPGFADFSCASDASGWKVWT